MEKTPQQLFEEKIQLMQTKFILSLPERLAEIQSTWRRVQVQEQKDLQQENLHILHRLVHTLTGSAGTFSLKVLSEEARTLEVFIKTILAANTNRLNPEETAQIQSLLTTIVDEIAQTKPGTDTRSLNHDLSPQIKESHEQNQILIVEDDEEVTTYLSLQLAHFGYEVQIVGQLKNVQAALEAVPPDLVIFDIHFPEGSLAGAEKVQELQSLLSRDIPVIFISARQDIEARLSAVRAGGQAYFSKPINISSLVEKVNELTEHEIADPYHILMVDDDPAIVELATYLLKRAGMDAVGITNPLETLNKISETKPDLILLDLHMPECTGIELAKVIRQHKNLSNIPVIFLSAETDSSLKLETAIEGGDEFLEKPIKIDELAPFISTRAKRARELSALMIKDGLTGLYNHTYTKELIDHEMDRILRSGCIMSVAMIDVDFFKKVNDTHGHMVGDQVLRSLSNYLLKRLRKTDYIGRYGGEEFVIIMPDTSLDSAQKVMNDILKSFSYVEHHAPDEDFTITFSGGVISSEQTKNTGLLMKSVDEALYEAKQAGRNQIKTVTEQKH